MLEPERTLAIRDRGRIVAGTGIFTRRLAVPGGVVPAAAVTLVGVPPTHRRRGLMSTLMRRQLADVHEGGREAVAILWASEPVIYGRFGYGLATHDGATSTSPRGERSPAPDADAEVDLLTPADALRAMRAVHEAVWPTVPGMLDRDGPGGRTASRTPRSTARAPAAARRRHRGRLRALRRQAPVDEDGPDSEVVVMEALAATPEGEAAIWGYLIGLDLTRRVTWDLAPSDQPLMHMVANAVRASLGLRAVGAARRRPARAGRAHLRRAVRGRARGRRRGLPVERRPLGAALGRHDGHLRAHRHARRARARRRRAGRRLPRRHAARGARPRGRVRELRSGALAAASRAFAGDRAPWCPEIF